MQVALIVDNPLRDLAGLALVATRLCADGATCHLVPMNLQDSELRALAPDAVVINYLRPANVELVRQLLDAHVAVFLLDTEGGVFSSFDSYGKSLAPDPDVRHALTATFWWGPALAEHAIGQGWFTPSQRVITGLPRFDFYAPPLRKAALAASEHAIRDIASPFLLINGNFTVANPAFQTAAREVDDLVATSGLDRNSAESWHAADVRAMNDLTSLTTALASRLTDIPIVYRPHPFESTASYASKFSVYQNIYLRKQGTVDGWILRSLAVVQRGCTTAVEATAGGVPALSPQWIECPVELPAVERVSVRCSDLDHMVSLIHRLRRQEGAPLEATVPDSDELLRECGFDPDGRAHERLAEAILARTTVLPRQARSKLARTVGVGIPNDPLAMWRRSRRRAELVVKSWSSPNLRSLLGRSGPSWDRGDKRFDVEDVRRFVSALALRRPGGEPTPEVRVQPAAQTGSYVNFLRCGRSITLASAASPYGTRRAKARSAARFRNAGGQHPTDATT